MKMSKKLLSIAVASIPFGFNEITTSWKIAMELARNGQIRKVKQNACPTVRIIPNHNS